LNQNIEIYTLCKCAVSQVNQDNSVRPLNQCWFTVNSILIYGVTISPEKLFKRVKKSRERYSSAHI